MVKLLIHIAFFIVFSIFSIKTFAQQENLSIDQSIEQLLEAFTQTTDNEVDFTQQIEDLYLLAADPINLNSASQDELNKLIILKSTQIDGILQYRKKYGNFITHYELLTIPGFDEVTVRLILPFIKIAHEDEKNPLLKSLRRGKMKHQLITLFQRVLEDQRGYLPISDSLKQARPNGYYLGQPYRLYSRYRFTVGENLSAGITAEKDPGEPLFKEHNSRKGFDYYSAHLHYYNPKGLIKAVSLGDYQIESGQGMTFWSGVAFGINPSNVAGGRRFGRGIRPYVSVNEQNFLRGGAATLQFKFAEFTAFYSRKDYSAGLIATLDSLGNEKIDEFQVGTFYETGLYRTNSEIARKDNITGEVKGGILQFKFEKLKIGVTAVQIDFNKAISPSTNAIQRVADVLIPRNLNSFTNIGVDYIFNWNNAQFFGEVTRSANNAYAMVHGMKTEVGPLFNLLVVYRNYQPRFQFYQPYVNPIIRESGSLAERGIYAGAQFFPYKNIEINFFYEYFEFPWLKFRVDQPSYGNDILGQIIYTPSRRVNMYIRYRTRNKFRNISSSANERIDFASPGITQNFRFNFTINITSEMSYTGRIEHARFTEKGQLKNGFLLLNDFRYKFAKWPITITARLANFETDSYDTRIYAYESDLLYAFSVLPYSGNGTRTYLMLKADAGKNMDVWLRWGQFFFYDRQEVGSGNDLIKGNTRTEIKMQVIIKF
jgi:hypothetical protein